jgi:hypothetical protein
MEMSVVKKMLMICLFLLLLYSGNAVGAEAIDEVAMTTELCQAQTLVNMKVGRYAIPENVLNTYFSAIAKSNPKVKEATLHVLDKDKILVTIDAEGVGALRLTCAIKELHFDRDNALLELYIEKKELVGSSVTSWFLNKMSMGWLTNIYGNPLQDMDSKIQGNRLAINLKPFAASLFNNGIGQSVVEQLVISKATTESGIIYLHTNCAVSILGAENKTFEIK